MTDHIFFFTTYCNNLPFHWVLQFLMQGRSNSACPMYPRAPKQARVSWTDVHHKESRVKSLGTDFDRQSELSKYCSLRTIKSSHNNVTGSQNQPFNIKPIKSSLRKDIQSRTGIHQYMRQCSALAFHRDVQGFVMFSSGRSQISIREA